MAARSEISIPLNRVEGDLEVRLAIEDRVVVDAWCSGTLFRGFERLLVGRGSHDGVVIAPRVCGICSSAHQTAAALALDAIAGATLPINAVLARNVALAAEHVQSDARQTVLMFAADFTNAAYREQPLFAEAVRRYEPLKGERAIATIRATTKLLDLIAVIGGQWPHSSYMVPGGIVSSPSAADLKLCRHRLQRYREWYEAQVLGCPVERFAEVTSEATLRAWLEEKPAHAEGDVGFFIRFADAVGLQRIGIGHRNFISFGALPLPAGTKVRGRGSRTHLFGAGFARGLDLEVFDQSLIREHLQHSWFTSEGGPRHPSEGVTEPYATGGENQRYSWAKAPRYRDLPAETGPLAELVVAGHPLFVDLLEREGPSARLRQLARLVRAAELIPAMESWIDEIDPRAPYYSAVGVIEQGSGCGLTHAARGALGHWVTIEDGTISRYQIITPTGWNASPRCDAHLRGPMEQALIGTPVVDADNPVAIGHVVRSFDPCLVCTVHALRGAADGARSPLGVF